jgi:hypothetical protein
MATIKMKLVLFSFLSLASCVWISTEDVATTDVPITTSTDAPPVTTTVAQTTTTTTFSVPSLQPTLKSCASAATDFFTLKRYIVSPYPILKNGLVTVQGVGDLLQDIGQGSTVVVQAKLGLIPIFTQTFDLCAQAATANITCPIAAGTDVVLSVTQPIAAAVPAGSFTLQVKALATDGKEILCLSGRVQVI